VLSGLARVGPWIFTGRSPAKGPLTSLRALWERLAPRSELPAGPRLYDATRHTFATTAAELEVPRDVRQLLMGHAVGREAHDRYIHATGVLLRAADLVAGHLAAALRGKEEPSAKVLPMRA
jgi:integrase